MRRLELDYRRPANGSAWVRYALIAAAIGFAADQATYYSTLGKDVASLESQVAKKPVAISAATPSLRPVGAEELAFARDTVSRLSTPWQSLFGAVESAHTDDIALLSIEPDAQARTVTITGEAKNYLAALSYMASLSEQQALHRVHLVRHETLGGGSQRPLGFTISAGWKENQ